MSIRIRSGDSLWAIATPFLAVDGQDHLVALASADAATACRGSSRCLRPAGSWPSERSLSGLPDRAATRSRTSAQQLLAARSAPFWRIRATEPFSRSWLLGCQVLGRDDHHRDRSPLFVLCSAAPETRTRPSRASSGRAGSRPARCSTRRSSATRPFSASITAHPSSSSIRRSSCRRSASSSTTRTGRSRSILREHCKQPLAVDRLGQVVRRAQRVAHALVVDDGQHDHRDVAPARDRPSAPTARSSRPCPASSRPA